MRVMLPVIIYEGPKKDVHCRKHLEWNKEHIDSYDGIFSAETLHIFSTIHKTF